MPVFPVSVSAACVYTIVKNYYIFVIQFRYDYKRRFFFSFGKFISRDSTNHKRNQTRTIDSNRQFRQCRSSNDSF